MTSPAEQPEPVNARTEEASSAEAVPTNHGDAGGGEPVGTAKGRSSATEDEWGSLEGWWEPDGTFHEYQWDDLPVGSRPSYKPSRPRRTAYWARKAGRQQKLDELRRVHDQRISMERYLIDVVCRARSNDATWAEIGDQLGMSRQAAHSRYAHIVSAIEKERRDSLRKSRGSRRGAQR